MSRAHIPGKFLVSDGLAGQIENPVDESIKSGLSMLPSFSPTSYIQGYDSF
jgi:hypothetical protein